LPGFNFGLGLRQSLSSHLRSWSLAGSVTRLGSVMGLPSPAQLASLLCALTGLPNEPSKEFGDRLLQRQSKFLKRLVFYIRKIQLDTGGGLPYMVRKGEEYGWKTLPSSCVLQTEATERLPSVCSR
jgi:hypothetical protein